MITPVGAYGGLSSFSDNCELSPIACCPSLTLSPNPKQVYNMLGESLPVIYWLKRSAGCDGEMDEVSLLSGALVGVCAMLENCSPVNQAQVSA